jgi:eukaryotic-like serine/threonine-protein kinase
MGTVYLAERKDETFHRIAALKIVRHGMDTRTILQRFFNERQILANLDHPNIARLIDGGMTDDDLPYFIMEYVDGKPITEYCDQKQATIRSDWIFLLPCVKPSNMLIEI